MKHPTKGDKPARRTRHLRKPPRQRRGSGLILKKAGYLRPLQPSIFEAQSLRCLKIEDGMEVVGASLHRSSERNFVAEWQRLMRRWETACENYVATCNERSSMQDPTLSTMIEQRRLKLVEIKQEIDTLISLCSRTRLARRRPLVFTRIETKTDYRIDRDKS